VMKEDFRTVELCYNLHEGDRIFVCRHERVLY